MPAFFGVFAYPRRARNATTVINDGVDGGYGLQHAGSHHSGG